ncbi:MAG: response regulator [Sulfurimicrobium sp.]|jgi:CheY-like chemotaxis protein|nr:response regulator [Sulfurimicrobium sp.]MDO9189521.1 response regulator [Sulfurimicrobium sp.]MDP1706015.1 response regulator [Sulfurimicrobium sp.]MDP2197775.1 response regulator [Sulfurimicrobium sp.]MDZ7654450.1 response regulator [Sulfurimicrobium sp.]
MRHKEIPPFYYPTTVVFVDDSRDFLANLGLQLDAGLAFRLYDSPVDALVALNGSTGQPSLVERFFSVSRHGDELPLSHHVIDLNLENIAREVHNERRFEQVSVVVVDYDMPGIDGLELCRNLKNPALRKILLTGKADEKVAVGAFNQGLIDRFILKQDADVIPILNRAIVDLQLAYFENLGRTVMDALALGSHAFLRDPLFIEEFRRICTRLNIVEFYLSAIPEGILMLDADGEASLLIVQTEEDMLGHYEVAYDQAAPPALLDALRNNKAVPYFWRTRGDYRPDCHDWEACLHPATEFKGREWYYYAVVPKPGGFQLDTVHAYNAFLAWHDRQEVASLV